MNKVGFANGMGYSNSKKKIVKKINFGQYVSIKLIVLVSGDHF